MRGAAFDQPPPQNLDTTPDAKAPDGTVAQRRTTGASGMRTVGTAKSLVG